VEAQAHFTTGPVSKLHVEDVHEAVADLEAAGIEILRPPTHWGGDHYSARFRGADGNVYGVLSAVRLTAARRRTPGVGPRFVSTPIRDDFATSGARARFGNRARG
jgi:hypothetical protein